MTLSSPGEVMGRLEEIEREMAQCQNAYEQAAADWARKQREIKAERAHALLTATGKTVAERQAQADLAVAEVGTAEEAAYEFFKARSRMLADRASIGQSILRAQTRGGGA